MTEVELLRPELLMLVLLLLLSMEGRRRFLRRSLTHPQTDAVLMLNENRPPKWLYLPRCADWLICLLLVGVLIQPVLPIGTRRTAVRALDLVLCIDLSSSMQKSIEESEELDASASQVEVTRLQAVKDVALDFIRSRPQDRIGLVVFSANAYLVNPLTLDHHVLTEYIEMMDGNTLIGEGLTSLGEGLSVSNELLDLMGSSRDKEGKAVVVFTDAEQNYGRKPDRPLEVSRQNNTRVYFIGVGVPIESVLGPLTGAVQATGGDSFDAMNTEALERVTEQIEGLQRNSVEITEYLRNQPLSLPLLALACLLLVLSILLRAVPAFYATA